MAHPTTATGSSAIWWTNRARKSQFIRQSACQPNRLHSRNRFVSPKTGAIVVLSSRGPSFDSACFRLDRAERMLLSSAKTGSHLSVESPGPDQIPLSLAPCPASRLRNEQAGSASRGMGKPAHAARLARVRDPFIRWTDCAHSLGSLRVTAQQFTRLCHQWHNSTPTDSQ